MPAHNAAGMLDGAVRGVVDGLRPTGRSFEVLIVENGSTDGTWELAVALADELAEVAALRHDAADYGKSLRKGFLTSSSPAPKTRCDPLSQATAAGGSCQGQR